MGEYNRMLLAKIYIIGTIRNIWRNKFPFEFDDKSVSWAFVFFFFFNNKICIKILESKEETWSSLCVGDSALSFQF